MSQICGFVSGRFEEKDKDSPNTYSYQTEFYRAACVNIGTDSAESVKTKMRAFWKEFREKLTCDSMGFNVPNGSLIKFGIARKFDDFVEDVVVTWGVDLNFADKSDNRTALDYVEVELGRAKGTASEGILKRYQAMLLKAGAKHRTERVWFCC